MKCLLLCVAVMLTTARSASADESLTLGHVLKLARDRSPELHAAKATVAIDEAQVDNARAGFLPSVTVTGTASEVGLGDNPPPPRERLPSVEYDTYTTNGIATAALRWTFFDFGRTGNAMNAAQSSRDADVANVSDSESTLLTNVANAYLNVVFDERTREIYRSVVDDREGSVQVTKALVKQGLQPAVEELRARSRLDIAKRDFESADAALVVDRVALLAYLGLDPKAPRAFPAPHIPHPRADIESAVHDAEEHKPIVAAARLDAEADVASIDAARARYLPYLSLNGDLSYRTSRNDDYSRFLPTKTASVAVLLTIPVYDPTIAPRLDVAKAVSSRSAAVAEQAKRDARTEAASSVTALSRSERILALARRAAESSSAVLTVIRARYQQGLSSTLDLIDAETTDARSRLDVAFNETNVDRAMVRVFAATGKSARLYESP